ncbi:MAG: hypothetical protein ABSB94_01635 [Syntrophorhabdales bacterium]|jgi:hypothetical protein
MTEDTPLSREIMTDFARLTGLLPAAGVPQRYLWTDAFAVCNLLGLYRETGDEKLRDLALQLVGQVHSTLGRYRQDDKRAGWISGLDGEEATLHPTAGGLRIGKQFKERKATEPLNERLEWDRDGQYFHYLTKWMHALDRVTRVTGEFTYNRWAIELARTSHARFVYAPSADRQKRMYWKMSTDLSYPLVQSMGLHDPLDGLITYTRLAATAAGDPEGSADLGEEIADMAGMCKGRSWVTDDPLGIGGLLSDTLSVARLMTAGYFSQSGLLVILLEAALLGLKAFDLDRMNLPANDRLAFRELGLSIGLRAFQGLSDLIGRNKPLFPEEYDLDDRIRALRPYERLAETIEAFWLQPEHRQGDLWMTDRHINMVMLATSISPAGYLTL